jgi:hypothetical protein
MRAHHKNNEQAALDTWASRVAVKRAHASISMITLRQTELQKEKKQNKKRTNPIT